MFKNTFNMFINVWVELFACVLLLFLYVCILRLSTDFSFDISNNGNIFFIVNVLICLPSTMGSIVESLIVA